MASLKLTPEDGAIQLWRHTRALQRTEAAPATVAMTPANYARQCVGWSIGRGFEGDYLDAIRISDAVRYARHASQRLIV